MRREGYERKKKRLEMRCIHMGKVGYPWSTASEQGDFAKGYLLVIACVYQYGQQLSLPVIFGVVCYCGAQRGLLNKIKIYKNNEKRKGSRLFSYITAISNIHNKRIPNPFIFFFFFKHVTWIMLKVKYLFESCC